MSDNRLRAIAVAATFDAIIHVLLKKKIVSKREWEEIKTEAYRRADQKAAEFAECGDGYDTRPHAAGFVEPKFGPIKRGRTPEEIDAMIDEYFKDAGYHTDTDWHPDDDDEGGDQPVGIQ